MDSYKIKNESAQTRSLILMVIKPTLAGVNSNPAKMTYTREESLKAK